MADRQRLTSVREHRKRTELGRILFREEVQARIKTVTNILKKDSVDRNPEELRILEHCPEVVAAVEKRIRKRIEIRERLKEIEDPPEILAEKCKRLAEAIKQAKKSLVIYTGAGISTAASIPDYRGPNGVWTLLQQGKHVGSHELSDAEPTLTHMAIAELHKKGYLSHVVSQNCDGLHLRSSLPRHALSEVHGNMFIEVCIKCRPPKEYVRLFDVTERTSLHKHKTGRKCHSCGYELIDTIVHFGEKGILKNPLNWSGAVKAANKCKMILCLGTSLKVLRKYTCLWGTNRPQNNRPTLAIVNLQWTPKDHLAAIKISGKCDEVMKQVMEHLKIPIRPYQKSIDPIFAMAKPLRKNEIASITRKMLSLKPCVSEKSDESSHQQSCLDKTVKETLSQEHSYAKCDYDNKKVVSTSKTETINSEEMWNDDVVNSGNDQCSECTVKKGKNEDLSDDDKSEKPVQIKTEESDSLINCDSGKKCDNKRKSTEQKSPASVKLETLLDDSESSSTKQENECESDSDSENETRKKKNKSSSTPGWFGKGFKKWPRKKKKL